MLLTPSPKMFTKHQIIELSNQATEQQTGLIKDQTKMRAKVHCQFLVHIEILSFLFFHLSEEKTKWLQV